MKTIREWLEELPEPYRTQALENLNQSFYFYDEEPRKRLHRAIEDAFDWERSPQGFNYWFDISAKLQFKGTL